MRLLLFTLLAACSEPSLGEGECRTDADCTEPTSCYDADDPYCGAGPDVQRECEDDPSCGDGNVCEEYEPDVSCSFGELSSRCVSACTGDTSCAADQRCETATGHCVPWSCTDGYTCPAHFACTGDEGTGCARETCEEDGDCGTGWCVNGGCFDTLGFCSTDPG